MIKKLAGVILLVCLFLSTGANFTPVGDGTDIQQLTLHVELDLSYHERKWAIDPSATNDYVAFTAGKDIQLKDYRTYQEWMENNCSYYESQNIFSNFTLATFRIAMGQTNGFRRATTWTLVGGWNFTNGLMETGDVIGWWVFEDLQKGYKALTNTFIVSPYKTNYYEWAANINTNTTVWDDAVDGLDGLWTATNWVANSSVSEYGEVYSAYAKAAKTIVGGLTNYNLTANRTKAEPWVSGISTVIQHTASAWFYPYIVDLVVDTNEFYDIDSLGLTYMVPFNFQTLPISFNSREVADSYYNTTANPFGLSGIGEPADGDENAKSVGFTGDGYNRHNTYWNLNWNFTYK